MDQIPDLIEILDDVLLTVNLDNRERFKQIVLRAKAGSESSLVPAGHVVVNSRLKAHFSRTDWVSEQISGLDQLFFLRWLEEEIDRDWPGVLQRLQETYQHIVNRESMLLNVTLDSDNWSALKPQLNAFINSLPGKSIEQKVWTPISLPINEGLTIPAQVNYVGKGANLYDIGYELHGSVSVISNFLRTTWLWEKIRVQGGAYGAFNSFNRETGVYTYLSYRDPNLAGTLEIYDKTANFLRTVEINQDELTKSIIGAIGSLDAYQLPDAKGFTSMVRYLLGRTDEERQQYREEILNTTLSDFRAFADVLDSVNQEGHVVVMGAPDTIALANDPDAWLEVLSIL
jgi:Zn-dependent M16 (insulinase) family peptidase